MGVYYHAIHITLYPDAKYVPNSHIPSNSADIVPLLNAFCTSKGHDYAYILHDKDIDEEGNLKKPHVHYLIRLKSGTNSLEKFCRDYCISGHMVQEIEDWTESVRYLCHMSKRSMNDNSKYKYPIGDIISNFDLTSYFLPSNLGLDECDIVMQLVDYVLEYHASYYQLLKYVKEIGCWSVFRKNFSIIDKVCQDSKSRYLKTTFNL